MRPVILILFLLFPLQAAAQLLTGQTVWDGSVTITESIRVERSARLIILPGTQITFLGGSLEVAGEMQADGVVFSGEEWPGIVLKGCDATTTLRNSSILGALIGVQVVGGEPLLEKNRFIANRIGVELRQKSAATIRGNRFEQNEKVGLFVKDGSTAAIEGNRFERNRQYAAYLYRATPRQFTGNIFEQNGTGLLVAFAGSDPELKGNRFTANQTGIRVERAARPSLIGNIIDGNEIGIDLFRRADPLIRGNLIKKNGKGVAIAYSSYPLIIQNNFAENKNALFLEYQSSVWEGGQGGVERSAETVRRSAFGGQNKAVTSAAAPRYLDGTIHAAQNWWGAEETAQLARIGAGGNPDFMTDGRDLPTFVDAGNRYPLDQVRFDPWQKQPFSFLEEVP